MQITVYCMVHCMLELLQTRNMLLFDGKRSLLQYS